MKARLPRALVVEDDPSWQQILTENLSDSGLTVDVAETRETALAFLRAYPHRLAVVDLSLEGNDPHNQDGLQVLEAVRKLDPGCATILVTGFATVELAVSALTEYKAISCLRKEAFQRSQLRELVHQVLASPYVTPAKTRDEAPTQADVKEEYAGPNLSVKAALVVEDDAGWRGILSELLLDAGFQVRMSRSFGEALGYLRREKFRLAVIDLSLSGSGPSFWETPPDGQDLEGYRLLSSTHEAGIPTIVVSGVSSLVEIERAYREQGIFAYLEKHAFDRRAFLKLVQEAQKVGQFTSELSALTDREREVLELLAQGKTNKEIADTLMISLNTVKRHIKAIFSKLAIHTRSAAAAKAALFGE